MQTDVQFGTTAKTPMLAGINETANAIKSTMGPLGHYVAIDLNDYEWPLVTNDGVTVANNVHFKDKLKNSGAKYVRQAAQKTNDLAGDGTTTASVLVQSIVNEGHKVLGAGVNPIVLRRQIEPAVAAVLAHVKKQARVIKQDDLKSLTDIATISCRDENLGKMIAELVSQIGANGVISIEDSPLGQTEVERSEGLSVRGGLISPFFVNHKAFQQAVYEDVPVIVTDYAVTDAAEVVKLMEQLFAAGKKQAVLIAAQIEGTALANIIQNRISKNFDMLPLRVIAYGAIGEGYLRDICAATGATFISEKDGRKLQDFTAPEAGKAGKVVAGAHEITFINGSGDTQTRIKELEAQLNHVRALEHESMIERIAKLQSKTASIKVGGILDSEREERKKLVEDAVNATKAALSDGIVTGGGSALYRASEALSGNDYGTNVVRAACKAPLKQIAVNSAVELDRGDLRSICKLGDITYNFRTGRLVKAYIEGIIDPAKVVLTALETASSAAVRFLQTDVAITMVQEGGEEL